MKNEFYFYYTIYDKYAAGLVESDNIEHERGGHSTLQKKCCFKITGNLVSDIKKNLFYF